MRSSALKSAIELAANGEGPVAKLVAGCVEVGVIVPSILTAALTKAGYSVTYHTGPGESATEGDAPVGAWVLITQPSGKDGRVVVARAYSSDKPDALLQAVCAWLKEESAGVVNDSLLTV